MPSSISREESRSTVVPASWTVKWSDSKPFEVGAKLRLQPLGGGRWSYSVTPAGRAKPILLGNSTLEDGVWSGTVAPDGSEGQWFLAYSMARRPEDGKRYLYGLFLRPTGASPRGFGRGQGTWGVEEDDPLGEEDAP